MKGETPVGPPRHRAKRANDRRETRIPPRRKVRRRRGVRDILDGSTEGNGRSPSQCLGKDCRPAMRGSRGHHRGRDDMRCNRRDTRQHRHEHGHLLEERAIAALHLPVVHRRMMRRAVVALARCLHHHVRRCRHAVPGMIVTAANGRTHLPDHRADGQQQHCQQREAHCQARTMVLETVQHGRYAGNRNGATRHDSAAHTCRGSH